MWNTLIDPGPKNGSRSPKALISVVSLVFVPLLSSIVFLCACFASSFPQAFQTVTFVHGLQGCDMRVSYITPDSQTMFLTIWHLTPFRDMTRDPIGQAGATPWDMGFGDRDHGASLSLNQQLMYYQNHPTTYVDLSGDPSDDDVVAWAGTDPRISIGGERAYYRLSGLGDIVYPSYAPPNPSGLEASLQDYTTYGLTDHNVNVIVKEKNAKSGAVSEGLIDNTTDSKQDSSEFGATFYEFARVYEYAPAKLASDVFPTTYSVSFESSLANDNVIGEIAGPLIEQDNVNELDRVEVGTHLGQLAPDFMLSDAGGRSVALSELRGRDILLVFWNIRCPYCAAKIPLLNEVEEGGLKVVSVALGATAAQVTKYIEDWNVKFDILPDTHRIVGRAYSVHAVPQPFWIDAEGAILLSGPENAPEIWSCLGGKEIQTSSSLDLEVYVVPYVGDIDGSTDTGWFSFYDQLRRWHDARSLPGSFSFYPETMNSEQFNQIIGDIYASKNVELILKGEDEYQGRRLDYMTYSEVKQVLEAWQNKFVYELEQLGYSDIRIPVTYNQLLQRFTETIRDAAHDVGFQMCFEQGTSDEYGYIDMLPDFDVTQYSVPLTTSGMPGPNEVFKQPEQVIQELLNFEDERMLYVNGIRVVPLLCHQQDFRISEESSVIDKEKFGIYTSFLTMAEDDPRIALVRPEEVYRLRHTPRNHMLTDFETDDHGWIAAGVGQGQFEIGIPQPFDPNEGACLTDCFGTGPSEDHSDPGVKAACTNLDGHMVPFESSYTNSLTSPAYDFSARTNVGLELWHFMEIEGLTFDSCYFQYKNDPVGNWITFEAYSDDAEDADDWTAYATSLSGVADGRSYFQLRFYCTTDAWFEGSGMCLDDIRLSWSFAADFDGDNKVNFFDYADLASAWMTVPGDSDYSDTCDLTGDNAVDIADLLVFANEWLPDNDASRSALKVADVSVEICDWQGCAVGAASISIDDSYASCRDILHQNGFRGTYYLSWTDTFSQADWDMWRSIYAEGHEIGGHTTSHGAGDFLNEATLRWELSSNRNDILMNLDVPEEELSSFAWPRGDTSAEGRAVASEYYVSARGYHINQLEDKEPADFMNLKSLNTPHYHDPEDDPPDYFQKADEAELLGKWVNYVFHNECLDDGAIDYLATKNVWVAPVGRVAKYIKERQSSRLIDIQRRASEVSCTLVSNLDPVLFNQKLTIRAAVDPVAVETVLVNGRSTMFTGAVDHILFNVHPSGSDEIRVILSQVP